MNRFYIALLIFSIVFFLVDFYAFQALKTITKSKIVHWVLAGISILTYYQFFFDLFFAQLKLRSITPQTIIY